MKRSTQVPLLVIGTVAVAAGYNSHLGRESQELRQEFYTSKEDCEKDWGRGTPDCTQDSTSSSSGRSSGAGGGGGSSGSSRYVGPRYYWDRDIGRPVAVSPSGETRVLADAPVANGAPSAARGQTVSHVARGGFGSSAHGFSSGG